MGPCKGCAHFRKAEPLNPLTGVRLVSPKYLELRTKWEQHLSTRALFEQQRFEAGHQFDFEPLSYPYCALHTGRTAGEGTSTPSRYVLCAEYNPNDDCADFEARSS